MYQSIFNIFIAKVKVIEMIDKFQNDDPLVKTFSEVEHPFVLRTLLTKWRSGSEIKFKMPYYPPAKAPNESLRF